MIIYEPIQNITSNPIMFIVTEEKIYDDGAWGKLEISKLYYSFNIKIQISNIYLNI